MGIGGTINPSFEVFYVGYIDIKRLFLKDRVRRVVIIIESNRKAMNRNWSNQKANPAHKTKAGNK